MSHIRKQFILDQTKIRRVRKILGVTTDTAAVNQALDLVIANAAITHAHTTLPPRSKIRNMDASTFDE